MDTFSDADRYYMLDTIILGSCQHLRKLFETYWVQQTKEKWVNNNAQKENLFLILPSSKTNKPLLPQTQQDAIKQKSLGDWDMTLLAAILLLLYKSNDNICKGIRNLKSIRNSLAHVGTENGLPGNEEKSFRKCSVDEYEKSIKDITESLQILDMKETEINKLIQKPREIFYRKALRRFQKLFEEAEKLTKANKIDQAIRRYSDAITTPNLLHEHFGEAYEKRAELYLKKLRNQKMDDDLKRQTLADITKALEINSSSWNACYLAAQFYELGNKLSLAISYYKTALELSPDQKNLKQKMEACKWLDAMQKRHDHFNHMSVNEQERVKDWIEKTGLEMNEQEYKRSQRELAEIRIPGQASVFKGHQYRCGWWQKKDFKKAARYYLKADKIGNAEGSYNIASCYLEGKGVKQDIEKAVAIFGRVAQMDKDFVGNHTYLGKNVAVSGANYMIGLFYDNGIFFEEDPTEAVVWYERAMNTGIGHAANNLARLYATGRGVPFDAKMAEMCWKQGVNLRELNSAAALVEYYLYHLEPELAVKMFKIGREMGNYWLRKRSDKEFEIMVEEVKAERDYLRPYVTCFEMIYGLYTKGMTFEHRRQRVCEFATSQNLQDTKNVIERKKYLQSPVRKEHILTHRKHLKSYGQKTKERNTTIFSWSLTHQPKLQQTASNMLSGVTPIYLNEMNPTVDNIFEDKVLYLTIIEDPNPGFYSIHLIAEDDNGDTTRLYIYNVDKDKETLSKFQAGSRILIRNPYMRIGAGSINHGIRNDEPKCITHLNKIELMCRFCGEGNAARKCSVCKRPYCSKKCQKMDWKIFQHKLICTRNY